MNKKLSVLFFLLLSVLPAVSSSQNEFELTYSKNELNLYLKTQSLQFVSSVNLEDGVLKTVISPYVNFRGEAISLGQSDKFGVLLSKKPEINPSFYVLTHKLSEKLTLSVFLKPQGGFGFTFSERHFVLEFAHYRQSVKKTDDYFREDKKYLDECVSPFLMNIELSRKGKIISTESSFFIVYDRDFGLHSDFTSSLSADIKKNRLVLKFILENKEREYNGKLTFSPDGKSVFENSMSLRFYPQPVFGGTSQQIKINLETKLKYRNIALSVKHVSDYGESGGNESRTDCKLTISFDDVTLGISSSLNRTQGGIRGFYDILIELKFRHVTVSLANLKKISFDFTFTGDSCSFKHASEKNKSDLKWKLKL